MNLNRKTHKSRSYDEVGFSYKNDFTGNHVENMKNTGSKLQTSTIGIEFQSNFGADIRRLYLRVDIFQVFDLIF